MTNVYSLDGLLVFGLLLVCTCAYLRQVPRLRACLRAHQRGFGGLCYKASVIGTRLHVAVAISCVLMAFYVLVLK
ncbi:protein kish-B [Colius striatus]|uniref:protein kish-B n=1 Tax=Colius striatus TaxID=57412 RepID=UPI002B1E6AFA|nr:protein kish-B [Colius striatus]